MKALNKALKNLARVIIAYPKSVLALCLVICAFLCANISKLEIDASTQTLLLENDKDLLTWREVSKRYETPNFLVIAYTPNLDLLSPQSLEFLKQISKELEQIKGVKSVFSILNAPLLQNRPLNISELLKHIPSLQDKDINKTAAKNEFLNSPLYKGSLVSKDFKTTSIVVYLEANNKYDAYINQRDALQEKVRNGSANKDEIAKLESLKKEFKAYRDELRISEHENIEAIRALINKYNNKKLV